MMMASVWGWNNHLVIYGDSDLNYLPGLRVQSVVSELGSLSPNKQDREYICSERVYECFANAGKVFAYNPKGFVSPEDVWWGEKVRMISRVL